MQIERPVPKLSPREHQLLKLAAEGLTDMAIAQRLEISEATVGTYWGRVRIKFGPYSRTELVAIMMRAEREEAVEELRKENEGLVLELQIKGASGSVLSYRDLLENAPDAMVLINESGLTEFANIAAVELFGYSKEEFEELDLVLMVPERFRRKHADHVKEFFLNPTRHQMGVHLETPAVKKDGSEFLMRAALSSINCPTGVLVICVIRSIPD